MLETFGVNVRNILNPCLEELLVRINLYEKADFKMRTIGRSVCCEFLFVVLCGISHLHFLLFCGYSFITIFVSLQNTNLALSTKICCMNVIFIWNIFIIFARRNIN